MTKDILALEAAKRRFPGKVIVPNTLKSVTATQNGNGTTQLYFQKTVKNGNSVMPYEILLDQNDAFVVTHVGFFLLNEIVANPGKAQPQTYPNIIQFPASDTGLVAADLMQFYAGSLGIKVAQDDIFETLPLSDCFVARTTQQSAATNFSESLPVDGYVSLPENFTIYGNEKYSFTISRPAFTGEGVQLTSTTTKQVKVLMAFRGFTVYGAGSAYQK